MMPILAHLQMPSVSWIFMAEQREGFTRAMCKKMHTLLQGERKQIKGTVDVSRCNPSSTT